MQRLVGAPGHVADSAEILATLANIKTLLTAIILLVCTTGIAFLVHILQTDTFKSWIGFLLTQEAAKASVAASRPIVSLVLKSAAILIELLIWDILGLLLVLFFICIINFLSLDIKLTKLMHIVNHLVADFNTFSGLIEGVFMSMDLR